MLYAKGAFKAQGHKKVEIKGQKTYELNIKQSKKKVPYINTRQKRKNF